MFAYNIIFLCYTMIETIVKCKKHSLSLVWTQSKAYIVLLSKKLEPYWSVLVGSRYRFKPDNKQNCLHHNQTKNKLCKLAFDFCRSHVVIWFFHPSHNGQWPQTSKDFLSQILSITFFSYLNSSEIASISLLMLSAKQGNYWYHFYYVFGMTRSLSGDWTRDLPHSKPVLYH